MSGDRQNPDAAARRATVQATERDTRLSGQLIEQLVQVWERDAELIGARAGAGALLAAAGEAAEFGLMDVERAARLFERATGHTDADPRAFAGVRRAAREAADPERIAAAYRAEKDAAADPLQTLVAGMGLAQSILREGGKAEDAERLLRGLEPLLPQVPAEAAGAWHATLEDTLFVAGRPSAALQARVRRWSDLGTLGEHVSENWGARSALAIAAASEAVGASEDGIREWYEVVFELSRSADALRPLLRACHDRADASGAEALVAEVVSHEDDADVRSRYQYELGMLRSRALGDRAGGLGALGGALAGTDVAPLIATSYLSEARAQQGFVATDDFVDALGAAIDFAASGVERADYLTHLATRMEVDFGLTDQAVDYARDALNEAPGHLPAIRLLGTIFTREHRWAELAEVGEGQLQGEQSPTERLRLHERQADLYLNDLADASAAERHLRAALDIECHLPVVRRLARVLADQQRWEELFDHLRDSAARIRLDRERVYLMERAGDVAEDRLRDPRLAIEVYRELLEIAPAHSGAISNLGRLLSSQQRWEELIELNELELGLTPDDARVRVAILCRSAEVARRQLGDMALAESCYSRALEEDPTCSEALQGLGQVLTAHERWGELVEMTERELAAASDDSDRQRCLLLLGEIHATRTNEPEAAVRCFEEVAAGAGPQRSLALVWLDRLFQAMDAPSDRLRILIARMADATDEGSRARLAFRLGELLEWALGTPQDAFGHYTEALTDPVAAPVALAALDRTWGHAEIDDDARGAAVRAVTALASRAEGGVRKQALHLLVERAAELITDTERDAHWRTLATEWPNDVVPAEYCAVRSLTAGDVRGAEAFRATAPAGPVELARTHWAAIEDGVRRDDLMLIDELATPSLAGVLSRESGSVEAEFDGMVERDTYTRMAAGHVALGELRHPDGTEAGMRLAVIAARTLEDTGTLRIRWEELAENEMDPVRQMRAWLDLASEDGFEDGDRVEWLRHAASLGCFHDSLRDELYDRMTQVADYEGLDGALITHLTQARPDPAGAARLALRRGRSLEMQGRRDDAIDALRYAAEHASANVGIAMEKARLEQLADQLDAARATLERCLDSGAEGPSRVDALGRLADLHQMTGGSKPRALACLEDAFALSDGNKEWAIRLASGHATFGRAERCVELLEERLEEPPIVDDIRHWQLLARVYAGRLEEPDSAAEILWMLFRTFPERRSTLSGLEEFHKRNGGARVLADGLGNLLAEGAIEVDSDHAAALWKYVGEINLSVLERMPEAEAAFAKARGLGDTSADAVLRHAKAVARQPGRVREAVPLLVGALEAGSADAKLWEDAFAQLEELFSDMQMHGRFRVARQVRATLGANVELLDEHVRRDPARELPAKAAWSLVGEQLVDDPDVEVILASAPLAEKVLGQYAPGRKTLKGKRLRREEYSAFDTFLDNACHWLGLQKPRVWAGKDLRGVRALDLGNVWVPADRVADHDPLRARFWAGWVAGLVFSEMVPFTWVDGEVVDDFFKGVAARAEVGPGGASSMIEDIASLLVMPQRRAAASALEAHPEFVSEAGRDWSLIARSFADRAGLIMCGDLQTAVEEILVSTGWDRKLENPRTRELVVGDARIRSLLLYAIGDGHFLARYESGLSERPFLFA